MPSFDIVSEVDKHELTNAVDQANREIENRFDFKGSGAAYKLNDNEIILSAPSDFQVKQMQDILNTKLAKRQLDTKSLDYQEVAVNLSEATQKVLVKQGIEKDEAKKIIKTIKDSKLKVQASIQGDQIRVNGKKRDDLQQVMALLREAELDIALQFNNFRD